MSFMPFMPLIIGHCDMDSLPFSMCCIMCCIIAGCIWYIGGIEEEDEDEDLRMRQRLINYLEFLKENGFLYLEESNIDKQETRVGGVSPRSVTRAPHSAAPFQLDLIGTAPATQ